MDPSISSVYFVPMRVVSVDFLIEVMPIYPSIHPVSMISPFVFMTDNSDLCCLTPETVMISPLFGVKSLSLLSSHASTICLPVYVKFIISIILSQ